jgi:hypothetical protein
MLAEAAFVWTLFTSIMFLLFWLSLFAENTLSLPKMIAEQNVILSWWNLYPSLIHQIFLWSRVFDLMPT